MEKKLSDKNFFTTNWSNWQTESSTDIWTDKISSKWHTKVAQCPMMKKKNFFKKNFFKKCSWIRGKQMSQICRLYFWQKKTVISPFNFGRTWKKQTTSLPKQCFVFKFSSGLVECSFVKLTERFSEKNRQIFAECP